MTHRRNRRGSLLLGLLPLLLLTSCAQVEACTSIGASSGVSVTVDRALAPDLTGLTLVVCGSRTPSSATSPACHTVAVQLSPGSDTVDQGCSGTSPDSACSATAVPNGTSVGLAEVALSDSPITVVAMATVKGERRTFPQVEKRPEAVYPNGPHCGVAGYQANVTLDRTGLH